MNLYHIFDETNNIRDDQTFTSISDAKKAAEAYRGQGITLSIYHIDDNYNTIEDYRKEDY